MLNEKYTALYEQHKTLYDQIDNIIWDEWEIVEPKNMEEKWMDLYRSFTPAVLQLKLAGGDVDAITDRLYEFDVQLYSECFANREFCRYYAEKIFSLDF